MCPIDVVCLCRCVCLGRELARLESLGEVAFAQSFAVAVAKGRRQGEATFAVAVAVAQGRGQGEGPFAVAVTLKSELNT